MRENNSECCLLEAYGDSMVDIGIDEGDLVLAKKAETASSGDIIVALTDKGNTFLSAHSIWSEWTELKRTREIL